MWNLEDTAFGILVTVGFIYGLKVLYQGIKKESHENANTKTSLLKTLPFSNTDYPRRPLTIDDFPPMMGAERLRPAERNNQLRREDNLSLISGTTVGKFMISIAKGFKRRGIPPGEPVQQPNNPRNLKEQPRKEEDKPKKHWLGFRLLPTFKSDPTAV